MRPTKYSCRNDLFIFSDVSQAPCTVCSYQNNLFLILKWFRNDSCWYSLWKWSIHYSKCFSANQCWLTLSKQYFRYSQNGQDETHADYRCRNFRFMIPQCFRCNLCRSPCWNHLFGIIYLLSWNVSEASCADYPCRNGGTCVPILEEDGLMTYTCLCPYGLGGQVCHQHSGKKTTHIYSMMTVIIWKHFLRHWPVVRRIHRSPVVSPHKGQRRGALMFYLICASTNGWANNRDACDLRDHRAHYDVTAMQWKLKIVMVPFCRYWWNQMVQVLTTNITISGRRNVSHFVKDNFSEFHWIRKCCIFIQLWVLFVQVTNR